MQVLTASQALIRAPHCLLSMQARTGCQLLQLSPAAPHRPGPSGSLLLASDCSSRVATPEAMCRSEHNPTQRLPRATQSISPDFKDYPTCSQAGLVVNESICLSILTNDAPLPITAELRPHQASCSKISASLLFAPRRNSQPCCMICTLKCSRCIVLEDSTGFAQGGHYRCQPPVMLLLWCLVEALYCMHPVFNCDHPALCWLV